MKKLATVSLIILVLTFAFAIGAMADSPISLTTVAKNAIGTYEAMVYANDSTNQAAYYVYTVNGVDSEPTNLPEYKAPIDYGVNEIYVTAYDSSDEVLGVSETIEIFGNDYGTFSKLVCYDFDNLSASYLVTGADGGGDKTKAKGSTTDLGGDHGKVAWLKSENDGDNSWRAWRVEMHNPDNNWFSKSGGKNIYLYELDVMSVQVGKDMSLGNFYYKNTADAEAGFIPFTYTTDGKLVIASSISATYSQAPSKPEADAPANEWINLKIIMDSVNEEIVLLVDDVVYSSFAFDSTDSNSGIFDFEKTAARCRYPLVIGRDGVPTGKTLEFYADNVTYKASNYVKRYDYEVSTVSADGEVQGLDAFPLSGGSIKIEFSEDMGTPEKNQFTLEANGSPISFEFSYDSETSTALLTPSGAFIGRESCKVSFNDLKTAEGAPSLKATSIEFSVDLPPYAIAQCSAGAINPGENAQFTVTARNALEEDRNSMILLGLYKEGGLESVIAGEVNCPAGQDGECDVEIYIPEDYNDAEYKIVAYLMYKDSFFIIDSFEYQV